LNLLDALEGPPGRVQSIRKKSCDAFLDTDPREFLRARSIDGWIVTLCRPTIA